MHRSVRAGVERLLGIRYAEGYSATRIHPEFQNLAVGDKIPYSPFRANPVIAIEPEQYLIVGNTVAWVLQDLGDARTRLIVRTRGYGWFRLLFLKIPILREIGAVIDYIIGEPLHHYMEKGMCIGIAERAEGQNSASTKNATARAANAAHARQPSRPRVAQPARTSNSPAVPRYLHSPTSTPT